MDNLTRKLAHGLLLCLLLVGLTHAYGQSTGTTYYVSSSQGNDNNPGTSSGQAWRSLSKVERVTLQPGDKVLLRRGDTWNETLLLTDIQGTEQNPIVMADFGSGAKPKMQPPSGVAVVINRCHYFQIRQLHVLVASNGQGIRVKGDSRYVIIDQCLVQGNPDNTSSSGITYSAYSSGKRPTYTVVSKCEVFGFEDCIVGQGGMDNGGRIENNYVHDAKEDLIRAIGNNEYLTGDYNGLLITGNRLTRWSDDAIDLYVGSEVIVEYNEMYRGNYPLNTSGNGIKLGGVTNNVAKTETSHNNVARYNKIYNLSGRSPGLSNGIDTNGGTDAEIYGNLIYDVDGNAIAVSSTSTGCKVYNNTGISNDLAAFYAINNPVEVYNNIFDGSASAGDVSLKDAQVTGSTNLLVNNKVVTDGGVYNSSNDLSGDPGFVNAGNDNYQLKADSKAINAGTAFGTYPQDREGNSLVGKRDIGSDEFVGNSNPPTENITIRLAGASTTKNDNGNQQGWGEELTPLMKAAITVVNYADPGESTQSFIDKGMWGNLLADVQAGDYVVIQFGHNDQPKAVDANNPTEAAKRTTSGTPPNYNGTYKANLKRMAQDVLDRGATPIINSPVERAKWINNVLQNTHGDYVPAAEKAAQEKNVVYLNTWAKSRAWMEAAGEQQMINYFPGYISKSPGNTNLAPNPSLDFTHTNVAGAVKNAKAFILALQASNSLLKQYIKATPPPAGPTDLWLEAECANTIGSDWEVVADGAASQGKYLRAKPGPFRREAAPSQPSARVVYNFSVSQAGAYKLFTRHFSVDGDDDSFWIQVNSGAWQNAYLGDNRGSWAWAQLGTDATYALPSGNNTITIAVREPNARLDKLFLTLEGELPNSLGQPASNACTPPPVSQTVWLEAECAAVASSGSFWTQRSDTNASGGRLLEANTAYDGGTGIPFADPRRQVQFTFTLSQAGNYHLLARHTLPSGNGSAFVVKVNEGSWQNWNTSQSGSLAWQQVLGKTFALSAGQNTITFVNRNLGAQLDKLAISLAGALPSGKGSTATNCANSLRSATQLDKASRKTEGISLFPELEVYPNPSDHSTTLRFTQSQPFGSIWLTDLSGKVIRHWEQALAEGTGELRIDTHDIPAGYYLLRGDTPALRPIKLFIEH